MPRCESYDPDNVFKRFKLLEFPVSFVGLSTKVELDVEVDITGTSYLKTLCEDSIVDFEEAREVSPSHRSYTIKLLNCHTLEITFKPTDECIAKVKLLKKLNDIANRFVFDLRVINVEGKTCCNDERHSEVGRYYISGQYEYCEITHSPKVIDFGKVAVNSRIIRTVRLRNESKLVAAEISYQKITGFDVKPRKFSILPNSSKKIEITLNPPSLKVVNKLVFHIRNPHAAVELTKNGGDENFLPYIICVQTNIFFNVQKKEPVIESLHLLYEPNAKNTFLKEELDAHNQKKVIANQFLQFSKSMHKKKVILEKFSSDKPRCYSDVPKLDNRFFCKEFRPKISAQGLFKIYSYPQSLDFGKVGIKTYGAQDITFTNNSKYDINIKFIDDKNILYTNRKLSEYSVNLKSQTQITVTFLCYGFQIGIHEDNFKYVIDKKFNKEFGYKIQIEEPLLFIPETTLKFGMATFESFISSLPVKIYNYFNEPINFEWEDLTPDVPFEILPKTGTVLPHGCNICDMTYISRITKTKSYEIKLLSNGKKTISIEANIVNRKVTLKFLTPLLVFKDVALNMNINRIVKLENNSREIAIFYVLEPLFPGMTVTPLTAIMRPKSIINMNINIKISCAIEFTYELCIKVNNKEIIGLPIQGNVLEPKLVMTPRHVFMPRVPCGMVSYVPVNIQNYGNVPSLLEVLDTGDENIFDVYIQDGTEKRKIHDVVIKGGQTKTVYVKVYDVFRREYDMYIPFKVNGLLGPPILNHSATTDIGYYIGEYEKLYEQNPKVKIKSIHKDINYFRIIGVFTVPWIDLSVENFDIVYNPHAINSVDFTMTNISKYYLHVCIITSKLYPHFSLDITTEDNESIVNETCIKFELDRGRTTNFRINFHPYGLGINSTVAPLYLDKAMSLPFYNLLFTGCRLYPAMTASTSRIVFPPSFVGLAHSRTITVTLDKASPLGDFTCASKEESNISVELIDSYINDKQETIITVQITVCCKTTYARNLTLVLCHVCGSTCNIEVCFCFTYCPITLHVSRKVTPEDNPFPFYPLSTQTELYEYMENCVSFVERWLFQQGFHRDIFPTIPDTFHALASGMVQPGSAKKGLNISLLNFMKRIAGPLLKHIRKASCLLEEPMKTIIDIHDTYKSIINLLRSRGANLWLLQAKFLLSYTQFVAYVDLVPPIYDGDIEFTTILVKDVALYNRLTKQCWLDLILQCYKVFIMDSCFFDCVCVSSEPRDIEMILINWYNEQIRIARHKILTNSPGDKITNLTTDLSNGIAIISAIYNHCPFLEEHLDLIREVDQEDSVGGIVHNACIIMETMNMLKLFFPLTCKDFLQPNYLQMLFLSVHLYVVLPMFRSRDHIDLKPPLLRTSSRTVSINPLGQEGLSFNFVILNNNKNSFSVEKVVSENNCKKSSIIVKYTANFVTPEKAVLLVHGYNKTRIFDTYMIFNLNGSIGTLNPFRKCKLTAPIYRPNKVDITVRSPFVTNALYEVSVTDTEPTIPMIFEDAPKVGFFFKRLTLVDHEITLFGQPKEQNLEMPEHRIYLHLYCLNTQTECSWIWFRSNIGEFFIKVFTQPRWDLALETFLVKVQNWPLEPCSCGEDCECYRSSVIMIPHRNELMLKALRYAMLEHTTETMMQVYDSLIETTTGQLVLSMLLKEFGTKMLELAHILRSENTYCISSKNLKPRLGRVKLHQHTEAVLTLPITLPAHHKTEKFTVVLTSECGMDIRLYRLVFMEEETNSGCIDSRSDSV